MPVLQRIIVIFKRIRERGVYANLTDLPQVSGHFLEF